MGGDAKLCSCHLAVTAPPLLTFRAPKTLPGTSLVIVLILQASNAGGMGSIPGWETTIP